MYFLSEEITIKDINLSPFNNSKGNLDSFSFNSSIVFWFILIIEFALFILSDKILLTSFNLSSNYFNFSESFLLILDDILLIL